MEALATLRPSRRPTRPSIATAVLVPATLALLATGLHRVLGRRVPRRGPTSERGRPHSEPEDSTLPAP